MAIEKTAPNRSGGIGFCGLLTAPVHWSRTYCIILIGNGNGILSRYDPTYHDAVSLHLPAHYSTL
jgi:hypothetical protein